MTSRLCLSLIILSLPACASRVETARSVSGAWFSCEDGLLFSAQRSKDRLLMTVSDGRRFELAAAPTSFGELFKSADTVLRIDDDFAVLAGGPVEDHTRCRQMNRAG